MTSDKPELIVFSQYLLGGGASFHRNMLANMPENNFEVKVVYLFPQQDDFVKSIDFVARDNDIIFEYGNKSENLYTLLKRLSTFISNRPGAVVASLGLELYCLSLFPKQNKTVYFICHDDGFLPLVKKFDHIIDVFIAHNSEIFETIKKLLPKRQEEIYFIPHGVTVQSFAREPNVQSKLEIVFLARHHVLKGLYDLPKINQILFNKGVTVDWLVMGDGPERAAFMAKVLNMDNFLFLMPDTNDSVLDKLKDADIFILPSRKDGLPVALLEAMSVGCVPVVSNFSEGIKKVVTKNIGFVLEVGDDAAFADAIIQLHQNRSLLYQLSCNSLLEVEQNYNIKKRALEYFTLYNNYIGFKKSSTRKFSEMLRFSYILVASKFYYFNVMLKIRNIINKTRSFFKNLIIIKFL
jgi:glycosyltransferase involved in cell wall biosynthesis